MNTPGSAINSDYNSIETKGNERNSNGSKKNLPILVRLLENLVCIPNNISPSIKRVLYLSSVWIITFMCYTMFHLSRKPTSVVKGTLRPKCTEPEIDINSNFTNLTPSCPTGWEPFDGEDGNTLLGSLDYSFLFSYAIAMFFSGHIGDRVSLRYFLTVGMVGSGLMTCLFGLGYFLQIHIIEYYIAVQIAGGIFQSTGWPGVVAVMNHWFGKGNRGLILGIWNTHTSLGNILGSVIPGIWAGNAWGWSFISAGLIIFTGGLIVFLVLVPDPILLNLPPPIHNQPAGVEQDTNDLTPLMLPEKTRAVGFFRAFLIPGVLEYSFSLFFGKLVSYTFLFWLPLFIQNTKIGGVSYNAMISADLSTVFDVGGIIGGILGGILSDVLKTRSAVCVTMYYLAIPCLFLYFHFGTINLALNIALMCACGILVNGPYGLITTAVTADLGTHESLQDNTNAKATVTAIIDGTGSIGAALGPLLAGWVSSYGWNYVFYIQMCSCFLAALLLSRLVLKDILEFYRSFLEKFFKRYNS